MKIARRAFLQAGMAGLTGSLVLSEFRPAASASAPATRIRIGSCRIGLIEAKEAGLDGVEIRVGEPADRLEIADPLVRQKYKTQMKETGLVISSFMMGLLNTCPFVTDPRAPAWLEQSIDAAKDLGARVILVAFFGKGDLTADGNPKPADIDVAVKRLKVAAPLAKAAGVTLAIEDRLSAQKNAEILERIDNDAVRVYYDVGNTTNLGFDPAAEIRFLKGRIACIHFKDGQNYLGEGKVQYGPIAAAIKEIGYQGWIVMETSNPSKDGIADARRNAAFIRKLFGMA